MRTIGLGLLASAHATGVACGGSRPHWSPPASGGGGGGGGGSGGGGSGGDGAAMDPNFHVFLLIGQSNMEGVPKPEAEDRQPNERVKVLAYDNCAASGQTYNEWYTASPPLHGCAAGVGPGDYFARTLAEAFPRATIGLVPSAISGVDIDFFRKNVVSTRRSEFRIPPDDHWPGAYEWVLGRARLAQKSGRIRGIIFHQGESDSGRSEWVTKVQEIVNDLRTDLGIGEVPFLAGELLYSGCCAGHNTLVNQLPSKIPNAFAISASGLLGMDNFHFDLAGQRQLGARYGTQMVAALHAQQGWVGTWAAGPQLTEPGNLPPAPGLAGNTLRQVIFTSIGGDRLRLQLSNAYGTSPLEVSAVHLATSTSGGAIDPSSDAALTFDGSPSVTIPPGEVRFSDPLERSVNPLDKLAVSTFFASVPADVTGHPGSRTTSYIASGDALTAATFPSAASTDHWYFLSALDVTADSPAGAVVALGDSITDGRGSTTNGNDRWPDQLSRRLRREGSAAASVAVLNLGIGGNAVLSGGLGPTALTRFERDVLEQRGVRWLILLHGVNDIGGAADAAVAERLIAAYQQFIASAHERGVLVYGVPILPFGGSQYASELHETARLTVNEWIRSSGKFDAVLDLEAAVRDPAAPAQLLPAYDSGDHLHLSPAGYQAMANAIDLGLFKP